MTQHKIKPEASLSQLYSDWLTLVKKKKGPESTFNELDSIPCMEVNLHVHCVSLNFNSCDKNFIIYSFI